MEVNFKDYYNRVDSLFFLYPSIQRLNMRRITYCLNKQLLEISKNIMRLDLLTTLVKKHLPPRLAIHCEATCFNKGTLVLVTKESTWATELRYFLPELRDTLRKEGLYQLTQIKILMETRPPTAHSLKQESPSLSLATRSVISNASSRCSYEPLKKALLHLAREY